MNLPRTLYWLHLSRMFKRSDPSALWTVVSEGFVSPSTFSSRKQHWHRDSIGLNRRLACPLHDPSPRQRRLHIQNDRYRLLAQHHIQPIVLDVVTPRIGERIAVTAYILLATDLELLY